MKFVIFSLFCVLLVCDAMYRRISSEDGAEVQGDQEPFPCPPGMPAPPPEGCHYDITTDQNGCSQYGELLCEGAAEVDKREVEPESADVKPEDDQESPPCPPNMPAPPPEGCVYPMSFDENGCIQYNEMLCDKDCAENEHVNGCGNLCEPQCGDPEFKPCILRCDPPACECKPGYARDVDTCVKVDECPVPAPVEEEPVAAEATE